MNRMSLKDIQSRELRMLTFLFSFCEENGLRCYLIGGTLLGAIRHHGFIPWDDDADVCMPRPDFEKLLDLTVRKDILLTDSDREYKVMCYENGMPRPFAKLLDMSTRLIRDVYIEDDSSTHLWVDILPIDGMPDDTTALSRLLKRRDILDQWLRISISRFFRAKSVLRAIIKTPLIPIARIKHTEWYIGKINSLAARYPYETSRYVGAVTAGKYGIGERMEKASFEKEVTVLFEGKEFKTFSCWQEYLTGVYGNYLDLPSEKARKREQHQFVVYSDHETPGI